MSSGYRLAIVVPRYGRDVNGGAETLAREYAERLSGHVDVTVLTTCSLDYRSWADHFPPGESYEGRVRVLRFRVPRGRDEAFDAVSARLLPARRPTLDDSRQWMDMQGPVSPGLEEHLAQHGSSYDAVLFIPYLYATTCRGLPLVADRAVLVPALHDEPPLRLPVFDEVFRLTRRIICSTPEEADLVRARFGVDEQRIRMAGAGIEPVPPADPDAFARALGIHRPYVLSLGRIDPSKGSNDLIAHHAAYRAARPHYGADLVMLGRAVMDVPPAPWLHTPGFVDDELKDQAIAGCTALVSASPFESLSLVLLEAWAHGRPTIVTTASPVLLGQTRRSGGGLWYSTAAEYGAAVDLLASRLPLAWSLGRAGWRFAQGLSWGAVVQGLIDALPPARGSR